MPSVRCVRMHAQDIKLFVRSVNIATASDRTRRRRRDEGLFDDSRRVVPSTNR